MKHIQLASIRFLALGVVIGCCSPLLYAADPIEVRWSEVCSVARGRQLIVSTTGGDVVSGDCMSINVDAIAIRSSDRRVVRIARNTLARIQMRETNGPQLALLGKGVRSSLKQGLGYLFSPLAPVGMVQVPGTLAWGAISAPFCLLRDLTQKTPRDREIKVM
jgi:hypothetical protein